MDGAALKVYYWGQLIGFLSASDFDVITIQTELVAMFSDSVPINNSIGDSNFHIRKFKCSTFFVVFFSTIVFFLGRVY